MIMVPGVPAAPEGPIRSAPARGRRPTPVPEPDIPARQIRPRLPGGELGGAGMGLRAADGRNGFHGLGPGGREGGRKGFPAASDTGLSRLRNSDDMPGCRPDVSGSTLLAALGKRLPLRQADDVRAVAPPSRRSR